MRFLPHHLRDFGLVGRAGAAFVDAAHAVGELHEAADVIGRGMVVAELGAAGGLGHGPGGRRVVVEPAGVIDQVGEHVRHPAGGAAIDGVDAAQRAAGDDLLHLLVMLAVAMLVADDGFRAGFPEQVADGEQLGAGQGDGLLEGDQLRAALDRRLDHRRAQVGQRAEAEDVGLDGLGQRGGVGALLRVAELGRGVIEALRVNVADAGDLEFGIGIEGGGVVHAALAHADDEDGVFAHSGVMRESDGDW